MNPFEIFCRFSIEFCLEKLKQPASLLQVYKNSLCLYSSFKYLSFMAILCRQISYVWVGISWSNWFAFPWHLFKYLLAILCLLQEQYLLSNRFSLFLLLIFMSLQTSAFCQSVEPGDNSLAKMPSFYLVRKNSIYFSIESSECDCGNFSVHNFWQ